MTTIEISEVHQMLVPLKVVSRKNQKNIAVHQSVDSPFWINRRACAGSDPSLPGKRLTYQNMQAITDALTCLDL